MTWERWGIAAALALSAWGLAAALSAQSQVREQARALSAAEEARGQAEERTLRYVGHYKLRIEALEAAGKGR